MQIYPLTLYHDGRCPVCQLEIAMLSAHDHDQRLRFQDIHDPAFDPASLNHTRASLDARIHAQRADGVWVEGVDVFHLAYRAIGFNRLAALAVWPPARPLADWLYTRFARHRHWISRCVGPWLSRGAMRRYRRQMKDCATQCVPRPGTEDTP